MNAESYRSGTGAPQLLPSLLDASVFTSYPHCKILLEAREKFFVSAALHTLLFERYVREKVFATLRHFVWRPREYLPTEKFELWPYLIPYESKAEYVEEIYPYIKKSLLPVEVKAIILDEYSFLKEHSSILMSTRRFAKHLHRFGVITLDGTNKFHEMKHSTFEKIKGVKWIAAILLAGGGITEVFWGDPLLGALLAGGGTILVLLDP